MSLIGQSLSHYRITAAIGAGGMGEVYRATDTKLGREVALKVLPASMAADPQRLERFKREARAIAALNHPHIVTLHSVEEVDGFHFLTMELVEGKSLDCCIPKGGMALGSFAEIAIALADALAAAHEKGILHRDLKPTNVMVTSDGRVKVLDFGLAKETRTVNKADATLTSSGHTEVGVVMGTPGYMSPEQIAGRELDHRTDIFSLGIILYEMATGRRPFQGDSSAELVSSILRDTPRPIGELRVGLPLEIARIVDGCLAKDARDRLASARDFRDRLKALRREIEGSATLTSSPDAMAHRGQGVTPSIAVLPFSDMSPARDHDWFCEGIAEEILNALTKLPGLRVATRTSAFRFKDPARDLRKIGETLGVTTLLEGSVRTAGSRLRVTAQVVNASDGYQLWSERFDREMEDVFEIQDEIAKKVVEALELRLVMPSGAHGQPRHSTDIEAYHLFLKGRHLRYTKLDLRAALRCFEEAVEHDPAYALARIALAETLALQVLYGMIPPSIGQARARKELRNARELDEESAQALGVEACLALLYDWDTHAALERFERSLELDPTSINVRAWYGWALNAGGRPDEAVEQARRIVQMDPQSSYANAVAGHIHVIMDRVEEAIKLQRRAAEIAPDSLLAAWNLGMCLAAASAWEDANEWFSRAVDRSSRAPIFLGMLAWCQAASGRQDQARQTVGELERRAATEYVPPLFLAFALSEMGERERARTLLAEAFEERASMLVLQGMPFFRQLRAEPLMEDLRRRLLGKRSGEISE